MNALFQIFVTLALALFCVGALYTFPRLGLALGNCVGSVTLVNLSGFVRGIASDETGINISKFVCRIAPEWKEFLPGKTNEKRGFALAPPELTISLEGEISGTTGIMAITFSTGATLANSVAYFGAPSTGIYMDNAEVSNDRAGWKSVSMELSSNAGIT